MEFTTNLGLVTLLILGVFIFGFMMLFVRMYKKPGQHESIVITGAGGTRVFFTGTIVIPVLHRMEVMDLSLKTIELSRTSSEGLICKDNIRADIKANFFVRVNNTDEDVRKVALSIGSERASEPETIGQLFNARFSEALKTVARQLEFVELYNARDAFKEEVIKLIGYDLNGYVLDDCAFDYLEQTPIYQLDPNNILDAKGIEKILEQTSKQRIGKICQVISAADAANKGKAEIKIDKGSYSIDVRTKTGVTIETGENGLITNYDENDKSYLIEPYHLN